MPKVLGLEYLQNLSGTLLLVLILMAINKRPTTALEPGVM
jgi:hypothetical protein